VALLLGGCNQLFGLAPTTMAADADAAASIDATPLGPWGNPSKLGVGAAGTFEDDPTLSADELELYFSLFDMTTQKDLQRAVRDTTGDPWGPVSPVITLDTVYSDGTPRLSADGRTLYFASDRPGGLGVDDIWASIRASATAPWQTPANVTAINSAGNDRTATPCAGGGEFALASDRGGATSDLYEAVGALVTPIVELGSDADQELGPFITEDCRTLYFSSNRAGTYDLYVATRDSAGDPYGAVERIGELSTDTDDEMDPWVSPDGHHIVFSSVPPGGDSDLMESFR
jgi:Tol biopolymer transport system component